MVSDNQQKQLSAVFITQRKNRNLLNKFAGKMTVRKIIGKKISLHSFLLRIDDYSDETALIVDITAVTERDRELLNCLSNIQMRREDMNIIIFAPESQAGDRILQELVMLGFSNIVAENRIFQENRWETFLNDLNDCLFGGGLKKEKSELYLRRLYENETAYEPKPAEKATAYYNDYSNCSFYLDFYGTAKRVGTTSAALLASQYFARSGQFVQFFFQSKTEYEYFVTYYQSQLHISDNEQNRCTGSGVVYCAPSKDVEDSHDDEIANCHIIIRDCGVFSAKVKPDPEKVIVLVSANDFSDFYNTMKVQKQVFKLNTAAINLVNFSETPVNVNLTNDSEKLNEAFAVPFSPSKMDFPDSGISEFNKAFAMFQRFPDKDGEENNIYDSVNRQEVSEAEFVDQEETYNNIFNYD